MLKAYIMHSLHMIRHDCRWDVRCVSREVRAAVLLPRCRVESHDRLTRPAREATYASSRHHNLAHSFALTHHNFTCCQQHHQHKMSSFLHLNRSNAMYESSSTLVDADIYYDVDPACSTEIDDKSKASDWSTIANSDLYSTNTTVDPPTRVPSHEAKCGCKTCRNNKRLHRRIISYLSPLITILRNAKQKLSRTRKVGSTE